MFRKTFRLLRLTIVAAITILALFWFAIDSQPKVQQAAIAAQPQSVDPLMINPVVWSSLTPLIHPVKGTDGRIHLIYGLHVSNASRHDVRLTSIEVLDDRENRITGVNRVVSSDGQDVTGKVRPFSLPNPTMDAADYTDRLGPGQGGVVYFDVVYSGLRDVPNSLKHRITTSFQDPEQEPQTYTAIDPGTEVSRQEAVVIAPPLKGDNWLNAMHFQISDSSSFLNTNGLPFVFEQMTYQGQLTATLDSASNTVFSGETPAIDARGAGRRTAHMPLTLDLIGFR